MRSFLPSNGKLLRLLEPSGACAFDVSCPVRVDSGLMEGMEISTHYDPMISKLIAWGNTREAAIDTMARALDEYVIVGSTPFAHNVPFLAELCRSERFRRGETPTSFIAEEFPSGFKGVGLEKVEVLRTVAAALLVHTSSQIELRSAPDSSVYHEASPANDEWVVVLSDDGASTAMGAPRSFRVEVEASDAVAATLLVTPVGPEGEALAPTETYDLEAFDWDESPLVRLDDGDGLKIVQYLGRSKDSFGALKLSTAGASILANVLTPTEFRLSRWMLPPEVKDLSDMIQSPMPGLLVDLSVQEGQAIEEGQEVAVVEAMKMQNVLRSPRKGVVEAVHVRQGATLKVDELIVSLLQEDKPGEKATSP